MILTKLAAAKAITPPKWLPNSTAYLTIMGSFAYGVSGDSSDMDVYGFCFPPLDLVFPHVGGEIPGFGRQIQRFEQWQQHHVVHPDNPKQNYDFAVFSIVKYFQLCMENNPNMLNSLFTPRNCIIHSTEIGEIVREHRREFLHKGAWHKFKGYAYSQMAKIRNKANAQNPARAETIEKHGYDLKFAYHTVRLLNECEQILVEGDLDIQRNREQLKAIRRGEWTLEQLEAYFTQKEAILEAHYASSTLRHSPDEERLKAILMNCLETYYGSITAAVSRDVSVDAMVRDLEGIIVKYRTAEPEDLT